MRAASLSSALIPGVRQLAGGPPRRIPRRLELAFRHVARRQHRHAHPARQPVDLPVDQAEPGGSVRARTGIRPAHQRRFHPEHAAAGGRVGPPFELLRSHLVAVARRQVGAQRDLVGEELEAGREHAPVAGAEALVSLTDAGPERRVHAFGVQQHGKCRRAVGIRCEATRPHAVDACGECTQLGLHASEEQAGRTCAHRDLWCRACSEQRIGVLADRNAAGDADAAHIRVERQTLECGNFDRVRVPARRAPVERLGRDRRAIGRDTRDRTRLSTQRTAEVADRATAPGGGELGVAVDQRRSRSHRCRPGRSRRLPDRCGRRPARRGAPSRDGPVHPPSHRTRTRVDCVRTPRRRAVRHRGVSRPACARSRARGRCPAA